MIMSKFCIKFARWVSPCSQICSLETIHSFVFVERSRCLSIIIDTTTQGVANTDGHRDQVETWIQASCAKFHTLALEAISGKP